MTNAWERRVSLRLVSLKLSNVYSGVFRQELALTTATNTPQQKKGLVNAIDSLKARFGEQAVMRGHDYFSEKTGRQTPERSNSSELSEDFQAHSPETSAAILSAQLQKLLLIRRFTSLAPTNRGASGQLRSQSRRPDGSQPARRGSVLSDCHCRRH